MKIGAEQEDCNIRVAKRTDRHVIEAIANDAFAMYVPRMDRKPFPMLDDYGAHIEREAVFVLEKQKEILGYVVLLPKTAECLMLDNIAVRGEYQGRGYARALLEFAEKYAKERGFSSMALYTNEAMRENLTLYPHLGFSETHRAVENGYRRVFFMKKV